MRLSALILLVAACNLRGLPNVDEATGEVPKFPPQPTFLTSEYTTTATTVTVRFTDVCKDGNCAYQFFKVRTDDPSRKAWTDCGVDYAPRKNGDAEPDPQDDACVLVRNGERSEASIQVTLENRTTENNGTGITGTPIQIRTRDAAGLVSEQAQLVLFHDAAAPDAPTNIEATAGNGTVIVTWTPSTSPDVTGYFVYYGTSPPSDTKWSELNSRLAANGPSPVFLAGRQVSSVALANFPNGQTIYVGVTAKDDACSPIATNDLGEPICGVHESEKTVDPAGTPNATPGALSLREIGALVPSTGARARAIAVQGDLVVLASNGSNASTPQTIVELFDLRALTKLNTTLDASAARLGAITFNETLTQPQIDRCKVPGASAPGPSIVNVSKQIVIHGRYAFVASGTGFVYAIDLSNPAVPTNAWSSPALAATPLGCANGVEVVWPHLLIADGTGESAGGNVVDRVLTRDPMSGLLNATTNACGVMDLDAASALRFVSRDGSVNDGMLYVGRAGEPALQCVVTLDMVCGMTCNALQVGGFDSVSTVRFGADMPVLTHASLDQRLFVAIDEDHDGVIEAGEGAQAIDTQGPVFATASAGRLLFAGVGNRHGVDIFDFTDATNPENVGTLFTGGDVRDIAVAGPYVLAVNEPGGGDDDVALRVYSLAQTFVLVNGGTRQTAATVAIDGMRAFTTDPTPDDATRNFFNQTLLDLNEPPLAAGAAGPTGDLCFLLDAQSGVAACGLRAGAQTRPCVVSTSGSTPSWPAACFPGNRMDSPDTVGALGLFGPELIMAYTFAGASVVRTVTLDQRDAAGWHFGPPAGTYRFGGGVVIAGPANDDADFGGAQRVTFSDAVTKGAMIASFGRRSAVQTATGVQVIDRQAGTVVALPGLRGAAFGTGDVCGVRFVSGTARLTCFNPASGAQLSELDLGTSDCTDAGIVRAGNTAAITLIHATDAKNACEGVVVVDGTAVNAAPIITKLSLNTSHPSVAMAGENVYASCQLPAESLCQLRLRR